MTDKQWEAIIKRCVKHGKEHQRLITTAEKEYERRYGHNPSDVDDDWWIDTVHYCHASVDICAIKEKAQESYERGKQKLRTEERIRKEIEERVI